MMTVILLVSVLLQFIAAVMAVRLIRLTGERIGWALMSAALVFMAVRRGITMVRLFDGGASYHPDPAEEALALGISVLLVGAMARIEPVFRKPTTEIGSLERRDIGLRATEAKNDMLLSGIHAAVVVHAPDTRIVTSNAMARELLGLSEDQMTGKTATDPAWTFLREDGLPLPVEGYPVSRVFASSAPLRDAVIGIRRSGGDVIWALVNADPVLDGNGGIAEIIVTFIDITERRRAEEDLRRSEEAVRIREKMLNESQRVGQVGGWDWDAVHDVIWWSDEYYRIYGLEPGSPPPNYTEHLNVYTRESAARLDTAVKCAMEEGEPYALDLELAEPTADTHWVAARCEVKRDKNGKIWGLRGTAQNITERKRTEEALRENEVRLREAQRIAHLGHWSLDLATNMLTWSDEVYRIFGQEPREFGATYEAFLDRVHPEDRNFVNAAYNDSVRNKTGYDIEHRLLLKNGEIKWVNERCNTEYDGEGNPLRSIGTVLDITDRKITENELKQYRDRLEELVRERTADLGRKGAELQESQAALMNIVEDLNEKTAELEAANEKLKELDRLKSLFIASMSHELRTPLNSIIGFSSIMLNEWTGPLTEEQKENLSAVLRSGKHLLSLINDIIDVSKIEAGKIESFAEDFDVGGVVTEVVETLQKEIEKKGLEVSAHVPRRVMHADRRRLLQCLLNLVSNAVKYTQKGSITISADPATDGSFLIISVEDTGIGIREEDINKLFAPFVRLTQPEGSIVPGTGLGLYLTKKLAREILKGDILVSSTYGSGSRFILRLPIAG